MPASAAAKHDTSFFPLPRTAAQVDNAATLAKRDDPQTSVESVEQSYYSSERTEGLGA